MRAGDPKVKWAWVVLHSLDFRGDKVFKGG